MVFRIGGVCMFVQTKGNEPGEELRLKGGTEKSLRKQVF